MPKKTPPKLPITGDEEADRLLEENPLAVLTGNAPRPAGAVTKGRAGGVPPPAATARPGVELDHVLLAVHDLAAGASLLAERFGLASVEGGRHPGWGTANRIVPLDGAYLELVAVDDPGQAARTAFGRWIASIGDATARLVGWAARTERIEEVAGRLGLAVADGSRTRPDGHVLSWRVAGIDEAAAEPPLPFFIEWGAATPHPGRAQAKHAHGTVGVARLDIAGDAARLASWLGRHALPIAVKAGGPGVVSVTLSHAGGSLTLDSASLAGP